jgi:uncharacterized membrane protein YfcA
MVSIARGLDEHGVQAIRIRSDVSCDARTAIGGTGRAMIFSLILGLAVGAVMGLTGAGGGILAVPALAAGLGWTMQQSAPVALVAVAGGAAVGVVDAWRHGLVRYRAAILIAVMGLPFTALGLRTAQLLPQRGLTFLFACVMLAVALRTVRKARIDHAEQTAYARNTFARINPDTGRFEWTRQTALLFAAIGAIAGFLSGLLGVGGGFVIVPLIRRFTNVSMHGVVATSLLVIALVGAGGVVAALAQGAVMPLEETVWFALATGAGMLAGRHVARHLSARQVQRGFAVMLFCVAVGLLIKTAAAT